MTLNYSNIQTVIFNWNGQFDKTVEIEMEMKKIFDDVLVINSDDNNKRDEWINIGNSAYFSEQFRTALKNFKNDKKILLHIQGDTYYDNWKGLVDDAIKYFDYYEYGIYAPNITNIWYTSEYSDIETLQSDHSNIKMCACTDETVWFIHRDIIDDFYKRNLLRAFDDNKMGWGWDLVMCSLSFLRKRSVIRDYNHTIEHSLGTNYDKLEASIEMDSLRAKLQNEIKECIDYIKMNKEDICRYFA